MYVIYILLIAVIGMFIYAIIQQIFLGRPFGDKPAPDAVLVIATVLMLALLISLYRSKLETKITNEGVSFKWIPFKNSYSLYKWEDIEKAEIIKYGFVGYGLRLSRYGIIYNIGGNRGLRLVLKSGRKFVLGTQQPEEMERYLKSIPNSKL